MKGGWPMWKIDIVKKVKDFATWKNVTKSFEVLLQSLEIMCWMENPSLVGVWPDFLAESVG